MFTFNSLKEFLNFMPSCIICGKVPEIFMTGHTYVPKYKRWGFWFTQEDDALVSKNKNYPVSIDIETNKVLGEKKILDQLTNNEITKSCKTCHFKIKTMNSSNLTLSNIPLDSVEIKYTLPGGKSANIRITNWTSGAPSTVIKISGKSLPHNLLLDVHKISNLEQLNRRIQTLITFH